jgi:DNA-binding phage protein
LLPHIPRVDPRYPDHEKHIAEYLSSAARDENSDVLLKLLSDVSKAPNLGHDSKT